MKVFQLSQVRNWATGLMLVSVILLAATAVIYATGWRGEWSFVIGRGHEEISTNFVITLITFILGVVSLAVGIALQVVYTNHLHFMQRYDERMIQTIKRLIEDKHAEKPGD